jgi:hypothetical protein
VPCVPSIPDHSPPCLPDKPNFPPPPIPTNFNYPDNVSNVWLENENEFGAVKVDYGDGDGDGDGVGSNYDRKRYGCNNENECERENDTKMKGDYEEGEGEFEEKSKAEKLKSALKGGYVATSMTQAVRLKDSTFSVPQVNFDVYETSNLKEKIKLEQDLLRVKHEKEREKEREESEKKAELVREKEEEREREEENKRETEKREKAEKTKKIEDEKKKAEKNNQKKMKENEKKKGTEKEIVDENEEKKLKIMKQQEQFFSTPIGDDNDNNENQIEEENDEQVFESLENKFDNLFETEKFSSNFTDFEGEEIFSTTNTMKNKIVTEIKTTKNVTQSNDDNKYDDFDEIFGNVSPNDKSGKSVKTGNVTIFDGLYEENENENEVEREIDEFPEICLNSPEDIDSKIVNEESV